MVLTGGFGVLVVVAFVGAVALGRGDAMAPGDRVAMATTAHPIGLVVLVGRCPDERVRAVELRAPGGPPLWRITSARGGIDRHFAVGQDPPPFGFSTVTKLGALPPGPLEVEVTIDDVVDAEQFDPAHLDHEVAVRAPCGHGLGAVPIVFALGALGVIVAYGSMVRRFWRQR
ncbi:MAG: hypothetical protein QOI47_248 [Actinomycetota bacterium]|nr:hypothetical protein [Actinomycetota bacterium]